MCCLSKSAQLRDESGDFTFRYIVLFFIADLLTSLTNGMQFIKFCKTYGLYQIFSPKKRNPNCRKYGKISDGFGILLLYPSVKRN